jgi:hypothetical protein
VKHSPHQRALEYVRIFTKNLDVSKLGGVPLHDLLGEWFDFIQANAKDESPLIRPSIERRQKALGQMRVFSIADNGNRKSRGRRLGNRGW